MALLSRVRLAKVRYSETVFVVIWRDAHNGLQMAAKGYTGLGFISPSGKTMFEEYKMLMEELS